MTVVVCFEMEVRARAREDPRVRDSWGALRGVKKTGGRFFVFPGWGGKPRGHCFAFCSNPVSHSKTLFPAQSMAAPPQTKGPSAAYKLVSVEEATAAVLAAIEGPLPAEAVPLGPSLLGRVLAEDVIAAAPLPPFPASIKVRCLCVYVCVWRG